MKHEYEEFCEECSIDYVCSKCKEEGHKPNEKGDKCVLCRITECATCEEEDMVI